MAIDENAEFVNKILEESKVENFDEIHERRSIGMFKVIGDVLYYTKETKDESYEVFVSRNTPYVKKKLIDMENGQVYYTIR